MVDEKYILQKKFDSINDSIEWTVEKSLLVSTNIRKLSACHSFECFKQKAALEEGLELLEDKLSFEMKNLENWEKELDIFLKNNN